MGACIPCYNKSKTVRIKLFNEDKDNIINNLNNKRILKGKSRNKSPTSYGEGITKASSESSTTRQKVKRELYNIEKF